MCDSFSNGIYEEKKSTYIATKEETIALLGNMPDNRLEIQSDWILEELQEYIATGKYPYNSAVETAIIIRHGLTLNDEQRNDLGTLIYNAQDRNRREKDKAEGWVLATDELCNANVGKKVELKNEGLLGNGAIAGTIVKGSNGWFLMPPRARTRGYALSYSSKIRPISKHCTP